MSEEIVPSKKELKAQRKEARRLEKEKRKHLTVSENCKGCGVYMSLDQQFCSGCGAKRMYNRLTWRSLFEDFVDRFLNVENHILRTFIDLFRKPEEVIDGYINGVRKKHLSAFSYFAIAITIAGFSAFIIKNWFLDEMIATQIGFYEGTSQAEFQKEFQKDWMDLLMDYQSLVYFFSIPFMAIISSVVFWNYKKYNFVEQLVIYLYGYSHIAIVSGVLGLFLIWFQSIYQIYSFALIPIQVIYLGYVLMKLYDLDWGGIILKSALFVFVLGVILIILSIIAGMAGVLLAKSGALDGVEFFEMIKEQTEMQKAMKEAALQVKDSIRRIDSLKLVKEVVIDSLR